MAYYIRLENAEDLTWLQNLLDRYVRKLKENTSLVNDNSEIVVRIYDASLSAQPTEEAAPMGVPQEVLDQDPRPKGKEPKDNYIPNYCPKHKKYSAQRVPGTDCKKCWETYRKFHPLDYDKALRRFKAKQSKETHS